MSVDKVKDETIALPLSSERVRVFSLGNDNYEPTVPCLPSSAIDDAGLHERERFVDEMRGWPGMSAPREALYDLWLEMCRAAVNANAASKNALLAQAATLEAGLRLWWDEVHSPSGLVRVLRRQANLVGLYVLWARYGDYAAEGLKLVKELAHEKGLLERYEGASWTKAGDELTKEVRRLPVNQVASECGCVWRFQQSCRSFNEVGITTGAVESRPLPKPPASMCRRPLGTPRSSNSRVSSNSAPTRCSMPLRFTLSETGCVTWV